MNVYLNRVATVREKSLENDFFFQVRKKSGNFTFSQGNLEKLVKVREKTGNLRIFKTSSLLKGF